MGEKVGESPKAPANAGAFYFFSHTHKPANQPPIPGTFAINATLQQINQDTQAINKKSTHNKNDATPFINPGAMRVGCSPSQPDWSHVSGDGRRKDCRVMNDSCDWGHICNGLDRLRKRCTEIERWRGSRPASPTCSLVAHRLRRRNSDLWTARSTASRPPAEQSSPQRTASR